MPKALRELAVRASKPLEALLHESNQKVQAKRRQRAQMRAEAGARVEQIGLKVEAVGTRVGVLHLEEEDPDQKSALAPRSGKKGSPVNPPA